MGLGLALSGVSNIGHDIGGFAGPRPDPELFARWVGCGVFMPRFSIHSWNDDGTVNEAWMHEEVLDDVRKLMALRTRLTPYLSKLLARYRSDYEPVLRPTFYDFPNDPTCWAPTDDFMLGDGLLVAPVVDPGMTIRNVRLPSGADWRCGWTCDVFAGGQTVERPAPYAEPPFFVRAGFEVEL
jgi:alpha-glucosidase